MNADKTAEPPRKPATLKDTHMVLMRVRPREGEPLEVWLRYHEQSAALYAEIAEIDRFHHHEAMYWVQREKELAKGIAAQISSAKPQLSSRRTGRGDEGDGVRS
jgi:hypothetical protein